MFFSPTDHYLIIEFNSIVPKEETLRKWTFKHLHDKVDPLASLMNSFLQLVYQNYRVRNC